MRSKFKLLCWLLVALAPVSAMASGQDSLTLRQAIQRALRENPDILAAGAATQVAAAEASAARTQLLPQVGFTEDISRSDDPVYVFGAKLRQHRFAQADFSIDALNRPAPVGNFSTRLSGSWLAFDSFRTQKTIAAADRMRASAAYTGKAVDQKVVFGVVQAYQAVLFAERQVAVAQHEGETADALLHSVDQRVQAGLAVESDRLSAQVNSAAMRQALIAAQGELELAWAGLRTAVGSDDLPQTTLQPMGERTFPAGVLQEELATAERNRPDLLAMDEAQAAQGAAVTAAKLSYGPRVSAYGNWEDDRGSLGTGGGDNWVAGVQVSLDLLPFARHAQARRESAAQARVQAQVTGYRQQIRLQVKQAHIRRNTAELSLNTARAAIGQATESLRILRNRYDAGLATVTDLLRAEDAERQAQANYWNAVNGNTMAYVQVLFATGSLLPDAAEALQ